jgi:lysophospholipase L1-like esterase
MRISHATSSIMLVTLLTAAGVSGEVFNAGKGGASSGNLLGKKLLKKALSPKPQLTILMVGTNDMLNSRKLATYEKFEANINKLLDIFKAKNSQVILMTIPPFSEKLLLMRHKRAKYSEAPTKRVEKANAVIKKIAKKRNLPLVDVYALFTAVTKDQDSKASLLRNLANKKIKDGVHPHKAGYKVIAEAVYKTINKYKLPTKRIVCYGDSITYGAGMKGAGTATGNTYPGQLAKLLKK